MYKYDPLLGYDQTYLLPVFLHNRATNTGELAVDHDVKNSSME